MSCHLERIRSAVRNALAALLLLASIPSICLAGPTPTPTPTPTSWLPQLNACDILPAIFPGGIPIGDNLTIVQEKDGTFKLVYCNKDTNVCFDEKGCTYNIKECTRCDWGQVCIAAQGSCPWDNPQPPARCDISVTGCGCDALFTLLDGNLSCVEGHINSDNLALTCRWEPGGLPYVGFSCTSACGELQATLNPDGTYHARVKCCDASQAPILCNVRGITGCFYVDLSGNMSGITGCSVVGGIRW